MEDDGQVPGFAEFFKMLSPPERAEAFDAMCLDLTTHGLKCQLDRRAWL
jgi:hypothetical protein